MTFAKTIKKKCVAKLTLEYLLSFCLNIFKNNLSQLRGGLVKKFAEERGQSTKLYMCVQGQGVQKPSLICIRTLWKAPKDKSIKYIKKSLKTNTSLHQGLFPQNLSKTIRFFAKISFRKWTKKNYFSEVSSLNSKK